MKKPRHDKKSYFFIVAEAFWARWVDGLPLGVTTLGRRGQAALKGRDHKLLGRTKGMPSLLPRAMHVCYIGV